MSREEEEFEDGSDIGDDGEDSVDDGDEEIESGSEEASEIQNDEDEDEDGSFQQFSRTVGNNSEDAQRKSEVVRMQLGLWDGLVETRIKLQKPLLSCNSLPQLDNFSSLKKQLNKSETKELEKVQNELRNLLVDLTALQDDLLSANLAAAGTGKAALPDDDEEIPSDDDEEPQESSVERLSTKFQKGLSLDELDDLMEKRFRNLTPYRNNVLKHWAEKTSQFSVGNKKGFTAFEQPILQQIEHILADKDRLVERTQVMRSIIQIIGTSPSDSNLPPESTKRNPEVFDDDDFYHQLLKELIERKTADSTDPIELSRQQIQLANLRKKTKKKVDPGATRDRKLKQDTIPKLVNFMASQPVCQVSEQARTDLFRSLFGKLSGETNGKIDDDGDGVGIRLLKA